MKWTPWTVYHLATDLDVIRNFRLKSSAVSCAKRLGDLGFDWTSFTTVAELKYSGAIPPEVRKAVGDEKRAAS